MTSTNATTTSTPVEVRGVRVSRPDVRRWADPDRPVRIEIAGVAHVDLNADEAGQIAAALIAAAGEHEPALSAVGVLADVAAERSRQDAKWGEQNHPDGTGGPVRRREAAEMRARCQFLAKLGTVDWRAILLEEVYEALAEDDSAALRAELLQVAAVSVAWAEAIDRRPVTA